MTWRAILSAPKRPDDPRFTRKGAPCIVADAGSHESSHARAMRAPRPYDSPSGLERCGERFVVVLADMRRGRVEQAPRVSGTRREQVDDVDRAEAPPRGEADAFPDRRIVVGLVGRRGVQTDEDAARCTIAPAAPEPVPVSSAGAEGRAGVEIESKPASARRHASKPPRSASRASRR